MDGMIRNETLNSQPGTDYNSEDLVDASGADQTAAVLAGKVHPLEAQKLHLTLPNIVKHSNTIDFFIAMNSIHLKFYPKAYTPYP